MRDDLVRQSMNEDEVDEGVGLGKILGAGALGFALGRSMGDGTKEDKKKEDKTAAADAIVQFALLCGMIYVAVKVIKVLFVVIGKVIEALFVVAAKVLKATCVMTQFLMVMVFKGLKAPPYWGGFCVRSKYESKAQTTCSRICGWFLILTTWQTVPAGVIWLAKDSEGYYNLTFMVCTWLFVNGLTFFLVSCYLRGMKAGEEKNKKRRMGCDAENMRFMERYNLVRKNESTVYDERKDQWYDVDSISDTEIVLSPRNLSGQKVFITIDSNGRYVRFSGLVDVEEREPCR